MNVLETGRLWREIANEVSRDYPEVELIHMLADNAAMKIITNPSEFDVIVAAIRTMVDDVVNAAIRIMAVGA